MRKLIILALAVAALGGGIALYATYQRQYILSKATQAEMAGLRQSLDGLAAADKLGTNAAFIALDRSVFEKLGAAMTSRSVSLRSKKLADTIDLTVNAVSIRPEAGRMAVTLDATAKSAKSGLAASLRIDGFVYFAGITEAQVPSGDAPMDAAIFRFLPVSVTPNLRYGFLNLRARKFVSDAITAGALSFLFDRLSWKVAYRPGLAFTYDSKSTITQHFGQSNSGTVVLQVTPSLLRFRRWLKVLAPVFTPRGVVLAASLDPSYQPPSTIPPPVAGATPDDIAAAEHQVEAKMAALDGYFSKDVAVTIGREALANLSDQLGAALSSFSLTARGQSISGRLFDKPWRDKNSGKGRVFCGGPRRQSDRSHSDVRSAQRHYGSLGRPAPGATGACIFWRAVACPCRSFDRRRCGNDHWH